MLKSFSVYLSSLKKKGGTKIEGCLEWALLLEWAVISIPREAKPELSIVNSLDPIMSFVIWSEFLESPSCLSQVIG